MRLYLPILFITILSLASACSASPAPSEAPAQPEAATGAPAEENTAVEEPAVEEPAAEVDSTQPSNEETTPVQTQAKLNLNEATREEFLTLPDVGNRMVREFLEYRPYISIQQFRREIGKYVDEAQVAAYEESLFVPIRVNDSDEATLQQLPGVDESVSSLLVEGRPYADSAAFLDELSNYVSEEQLALARSYLAAE